MTGDLPARLAAVIACAHTTKPAAVDAECQPLPALRNGCASGQLTLQQLHRLLQAQAGELARCQAALQAAQRELVRSRASQLRAQHLALHDGLTALPNRHYFQQRMAQVLVEQRVAHAQREQRAARMAPEQPEAVLAVLVLDLDGFKAINDRHGHAAGDALLRIIGARLKRAVRGQDMVCRLGGDEFACMLANLPGRPQLALLAAKLIGTVEAPVTMDTLQVSVRPSIGIARCPTDGIDTNALLRRADAAMFRAKRERLGHAFFDARCDA